MDGIKGFNQSSFLSKGDGIYNINIFDDEENKSNIYGIDEDIQEENEIFDEEDFKQNERNHKTDNFNESYLAFESIDRNILIQIRNHMKRILPDDLYAFYKSIRRIPRKNHSTNARTEENKSKRDKKSSTLMASTISYDAKKYVFKDPFLPEQKKIAPVRGDETFMGTTASWESKKELNTKRENKNNPQKDNVRRKSINQFYYPQQTETNVNWMRELKDITVPDLPPTTSRQQMEFFTQQLEGYAQYLAKEISKLPDPASVASASMESNTK